MKYKDKYLTHWLTYVNVYNNGLEKILKMFDRKVSQAVLFICFSTLSLASHAQSLERLLEAASDGDSRAVESQLDRGFDPNSADREGNSLLILASRSGSVVLIRMLLARKVPVNARNAHGDSAVMVAALGGHLEGVRVLLNAGASLERPGWTALHYATFGGHAAVVRLLLERGAAKDAVAPNGYSALMLAARNGHLEAARELLYADADWRVQGPEGETALALARARKSDAVVSLLQRAGAQD